MTEQNSDHLASAEKLWGAHYFFRGFKAKGHVAAWLRYRGLCVYCESDLFSSSDTLFGMGCTDHLLPRTRYPELAYEYLNAVPCCHRCNWLKGRWDPNRNGKERYVRGSGVLTEVDHGELLYRARVHVRHRLEERGLEFTSIEAAWRTACAISTMASTPKPCYAGAGTGHFAVVVAPPAITCPVM
jgi:hypothetical protein